MRLLNERQTGQQILAEIDSLDVLLSAIAGQEHDDFVRAASQFAAQRSLDSESSEDLTVSPDDLFSSRVMIVDDEPINIKVARKFVETLGYSNFVTLTDSRVAMESLRSEKPDVLLLDLMMPDISGLNILEAMKSDPKLKRIPVIILTASSDRDARLKALKLGATDFLAKPLDPEELAPRLRNALLMRAYENQLIAHATTLEETVQNRTRDLCASRLELVHCLARAAEHRDDDTGKHIVRVGRYAALIAREAGMPESFIGMLELAAQLHDVGKIAIPDAVLLKPGRLTDAERAQMQVHAQVGADVLNAQGDMANNNTMIRHSGIGVHLSRSSRSPLTTMAASVALTHHERWDGTGYPNGLSGTDIPIEGRITTIADVFDALRSKRSYKEPFSIARSFEILEEGRGKQFDPELLDHFLANRAEVEKLDKELRND